MIKKILSSALIIGLVAACRAQTPSTGGSCVVPVGTYHLQYFNTQKGCDNDYVLPNETTFVGGGFFEDGSFAPYCVKSLPATSNYCQYQVEESCFNENQGIHYWKKWNIVPDRYNTFNADLVFTKHISNAVIQTHCTDRYLVKGMVKE